jgi:rod shape-determining protein MreC
VESLLNRYRNITVLLLVIMAQLVLLAVSAKNDQDVRFIRIWTVTAVTPAARIIESLRGGSTGFLHNYILLHDTNQENIRLRTELDKYKMENVFLKNELNTADRAKALAVFQSHTPSKTVAARIIGSGAGANSKVVFVDRGSASGVQRGMAVVTPDGIVGKVIASYPTASQVLLVTDGDFAAGVVTQKGVRGTLKGQGTPQCKVDYVAFEEKVESGELLFTSGDDRIFPRGFPVGVVRTVRPSRPFKEILVDPSGLQRGLEDVLILVEGVHQTIPDAPSGMQPVYIAPPPPGNENKPAESGTPNPVGTEADRLRAQYKALGEEQKHTYGDNPPGTKAPDFTKLGVKNPAPAGQPQSGGTATPPVVKPATPPATGTTQAPAKQATPPASGTAPPVVKPATPPASGTTPAPVKQLAPPPSGTTPAPAKQAPSAAPPATKPVNPPGPPLPGRGAAADTSRRTNQTAGAPPGGQLR